MRKLKVLTLEAYLKIKPESLSHLAKAIAYSMVIKPANRGRPIWAMAKTHPIKDWERIALVISKGELIAVEFSWEGVASSQSLKAATLTELQAIKNFTGYLHKLEESLYG